MKLNFTYIKKLLVVGWVILLAGCSVYKIDIQQGNEITAEMLSAVEIGMDKSQVRELIGLPLVNDPFHTDRWDYYFYLKEGASGEIKQQLITLMFRDDILISIDSSL